MTRDPIELLCREVVELLTEYLSHTLAPEDLARLEQHLATCPPCTAYLAQFRATLELAGGLARATPRGEVDPEALAVFRRWAKK